VRRESLVVALGDAAVIRGGDDPESLVGALAKDAKHLIVRGVVHCEQDEFPVHLLCHRAEEVGQDCRAVVGDGDDSDELSSSHA